VPFLFDKDPLSDEIIVDIAGLSEPVTIYIPIQITNNETENLVFKITVVNPPSGLVDYEKTVGTINAGSSTTYTYTFKRYFPTLTQGEYTERITLRLLAYRTDGTLYGTADLETNIYYIDHTDPSWTVLYHDTFDAPSIEGWGTESGSIEGLTTYSISLSTSVYLSPPDSLYLSDWGASTYARKTYTIPAGKSKAYIVLHFFSPGYTLAIQNVTTGKYLKRKALNLVNAWYRVCGTMKTSLTVNVDNKIGVGTGNIAYIDEVWVIAK